MPGLRHGGKIEACPDQWMRHSEWVREFRAVPLAPRRVRVLEMDGDRRFGGWSDHVAPGIGFRRKEPGIPSFQNREDDVLSDRGCRLAASSVIVGSHGLGTIEQHHLSPSDHVTSECRNYRKCGVLKRGAAIPGTNQCQHRITPSFFRQVGQDFDQEIAIGKKTLHRLVELNGEQIQLGDLCL